MDKNFNIKNDPDYSKSHLRQKISESIKRQRDQTSEVKDAPIKALAELIADANRDQENMFKHYQNKFLDD